MKRFVPKQKTGLVIVISGPGKGKTTSALGLVLRAVGYGMKVCLIQFIKAEMYSGEYDGVKKLGSDVELYLCGKGFVGIGNDNKSILEHRLAAEKALKLAQEKMVSKRFDILICDEINNALALGLLDLEQVLSFIKERPSPVHLILTGRDAHPEIVRAAHTVSEILEVKHAFHEGIEPQLGIDL